MAELALPKRGAQRAAADEAMGAFAVLHRLLNTDSQTPLIPGFVAVSAIQPREFLHRTLSILLIRVQINQTSHVADLLNQSNWESLDHHQWRILHDWVTSNRLQRPVSVPSGRHRCHGKWSSQRAPCGPDVMNHSAAWNECSQSDPRERSLICAVSGGFNMYDPPWTSMYTQRIHPSNGVWRPTSPQ